MGSEQQSNNQVSPEENLSVHRMWYELRWGVVVIEVSRQEAKRVVEGLGVTAELVRKVIRATPAWEGCE